MNYKTPGVYVEEVSLFPPSVAGIATAVPAFVGYTDLTLDPEGNTLINRPVRLTSFVEFTSLYGGAYHPSEYTVQTDPDEEYNIIETAPADGKRFFLYDALRHYFDNGGGPCYIVSTGNYNQTVSYGNLSEGLRGGLAALENQDEVTLLVIPDSAAFNLDPSEMNFIQAGNLHKDILDQCARLKNRFGILDMTDGYRLPGINPAQNPVQHFRNQAGTENLKYGAAYYPWLRSSYQRNIRFLQLNIVDRQSPPVSIPGDDIDIMTGIPALDSLVTTLRTRIDEEERVFSKISVTDLNRSNYNPLTVRFNTLRNVVMSASNAASARSAFSALIRFVREMALALHEIESESSENSDGLNRIIATLKAEDELTDQIALLIGFEKNAQVLNSISTTRNLSDVESDYSDLDENDWIDGVTIASISADSNDYSGSSVADTAHRAANSPVLQTVFEMIAQSFTTVIEETIFFTDQDEKNLFSQHPFFRAVLERVRKDMSLLPPSGAVAGVYATTDRTRGVWKAPANMSLRSVIAPAVKLTDHDQDSLNVHTTGKSINAIRAFTGKGILVWGARTLAGNDNEWRYVNVRRLFTYVEESVKRATMPFVFESNNANTWIRVRAMIENFLTIQWRQGALAGSTTAEAFFVKVGLGETMTQQDILEGRMIVEIGMAAVRPAEFIILRFSHKMQES